MLILGLSNKTQSKQKPPEDQATSLENRNQVFLYNLAIKKVIRFNLDPEK